MFYVRTKSEGRSSLPTLFSIFFSGKLDGALVRRLRCSSSECRHRTNIVHNSIENYMLEPIHRSMEIGMCTLCAQALQGPSKHSVASDDVILDTFAFDFICCRRRLGFNRHSHLRLVRMHTHTVKRPLCTKVLRTTNLSTH